MSYFEHSHDVFDDFLNLARDHNKPVMIAESTPRGLLLDKLDGEFIWNDWFAPYFEYIHNNSDVIRVVAYINVDWDEQAMWQNQGWGDTRVQVNDVVLENWLDEIESDVWLHSSDELFSQLGYQSASATGNNTDNTVTLKQSSLTWQTFAYELNDDNSVKAGSFDPTTIIEHEFNTWILENDYLQVTLLPEFGGRILSMIYKPTGHELLYQNPVGTPYLIDADIFYYDWLMVYGGIFPTFPEPEHGKTWNLPWDFEVVDQTNSAITVKMSFVDDIDFADAPHAYSVGRTDLEVNFYITLEAGRNALDTHIEIVNPTENDIDYEFWMNTGLAPGSEVGNPFTPADADIIAPVDEIRIPQFWTSIASQEESTGTQYLYILCIA